MHVYICLNYLIYIKNKYILKVLKEIGKKSMFFVSKVNFCFKKWTKKMSKNEKPRNTFEKSFPLLHILKLR